MKILFTSVGNLAFPSVLSDTGLAAFNPEIYGTDIRENAHGLYFCKEGFIVPKRTDENFWNTILSILDTYKIEILWPLSTEDQEFFSSRKAELEGQNIRVICSSSEAVHICNDKLLLYTHLEKHALPVPKCIYPTSDLEDFGLAALGGSIVVKTRKGTGGNHTYLLSNANVNAKIDEQFLSNISEMQTVAQEQMPDWISTEYLPGREYSVDCLSDNGEYLYGVVRKRTTTKGGLAMECEIVEEASLLELSSKIISLLGLSYINNLQFREDIHGVFKLIDINPRIPGTIQLTLEAGLPIISDALHIANGKKINLPEKVKNYKLVRYYHGVVYLPENTVIHKYVD